MNTKPFILLLILASSLLAKDIRVEQTRVILDGSTTPFYFPVYTAGGGSVLITQIAYSGLWVFNRSSEELVQITDSQGAGFQPRSLKDGSIIFRYDAYQQGRKFTSLYKADSRGIHQITQGARFISPANMKNGRLIYLSDESLTILNGVTEQFETNLEAYTTVLNDKLTLQLFQAGHVSMIAPQGEGNYIWSEISPGNDKLVYAKAGEGTFVSDLKGNIISDLGLAHAPQWSPDGQLLAYMMDEDDGTQYTASEIWIVTYDGTQSWKITNTPDIIEMYPQWAPDGKHLIYHSTHGDIIETSIEIVE